VGVLERVGAGEFERAVERPQPPLSFGNAFARMRRTSRPAAATADTPFASGLSGQGKVSKTDAPSITGILLRKNGVHRSRPTPLLPPAFEINRVRIKEY